MPIKKITIKKEDGTSNSFQLVLPEKAGTYAVKFAREDGVFVDAGNLVVDGNQNEYQLKFGLSNGDKISAGIFATPRISYVLSYSAMPNGILSYVIAKNGETIVDSPTSAGTVVVYHGDVLTASVTADEGYQAFLDWTNVTVNSDLTSTATASLMPFTLTVRPPDYNGSGFVGTKSISVTRTSSPLAGAPLGTIAASAYDGTGMSTTAVVYYGDKLEASAVPADGYNQPTLTWFGVTVENDLELAIERDNRKAYTLSVPPLPAGVKSFSVTRTGIHGQENMDTSTFEAGTINKTVEVFWGDTLTYDCTANDGYNVPIVTFSPSGKVEGDVTVSIAASVKFYALFVPSLPVGVKYIKIHRTYSPYANAPTYYYGTDGATDCEDIDDLVVYHGDRLLASALEESGYRAPTVSLSYAKASNNGVGGDVTVNIAAGAKKSFTLYYPACTSIYAPYTITRTSSSYASTGTLFTASNGTASGSLAVYEGDVLTITPTYSSLCTMNYSTVTVTGDVYLEYTYVYTPSTGGGSSGDGDSDDYGYCPDCGNQGEHFCPCCGTTHGSEGC